MPSSAETSHMKRAAAREHTRGAKRRVRMPVKADRDSRLDAIVQSSNFSELRNLGVRGAYSTRIGRQIAKKRKMAARLETTRQWCGDMGAKRGSTDFDALNPLKPAAVTVCVHVLPHAP